MTSPAKAVLEVTAKDLLGHGVVCCPNPHMSAWSTHPKIYIDLSHSPEGQCPYCGTVYRLKTGESMPHH